ncbi:MAG: twin-arginine translocase TatA/TatE family subunit, partial [Phycisphaerales bacterium]|nr:twin-arginine translocase TatA/TatE family subunit [Phycisphaerales bacterium]
MEWVVILIIALLLFGKRLPEVGKSLGKGIVEFKKGLKGVDD